MCNWEYTNITMKNFNPSLNNADKTIIKILRRSKQPISTYEIAKQCRFSWSTANSHCYKLQSLGFIEGEVEEFPLERKKIIWNLRTENSS